jgi:sulfide:quinone oxidoreductase
MSVPAPHPPQRVVIAGGGVAGLEGLLALRALAGDRVDVVLVAPSDEFVVRALDVVAPFDRSRASPPFDVEAICHEHGARFLRDAVHTVEGSHRSVLTRGGHALRYDALLLAVGARPRPALDGVLTYRGAADADVLAALVADLQHERARRVVFAVPAGTTWPLPLYELALLVADAVAGHDVELTLVTPESSALGLFGGAASTHVGDLLAERGIALETDTYVREAGADGVALGPARRTLAADRVVALPRLEGPHLRGVPSDPDGFIVVDDLARVPGLDGVFAVGDGATSLIKQGGAAAQQAGVAAAEIARGAGADVEIRPFRPVLRARLLTGAGAVNLRQEVAGGGDQASQASDEILWWPPSKLAAPYLAPYLARRLDAREGRVLRDVEHRRSRR